MSFDEKVIEFQKTGDSELGKEIFAKAYYWANCIIQKHFAGFGYYDDLFSEAHDSIVISINNYIIGNNSFCSYCSTCIKNRIKTFINKKKREFLLEGLEKESTHSSTTNLELKEILNSLDKRQLSCLLMGGDTKFIKWQAKKNLKELLNR